MAADYISREKALEIATAALMGNPYGSSAKSVREHIQAVRLVTKGHAVCGKPAWELKIHVANGQDTGDIDGVLSIDAKSGDLNCATIPFLD